MWMSDTDGPYYSYESLGPYLVRRTALGHMRDGQAARGPTVSGGRCGFP